MKSTLLEKSGLGGGGAFLTGADTVKVKKEEIKLEKSPRKPLPILKEEKIEPPKINNYEPEHQKVIFSQ